MALIEFEGVRKAFGPKVVYESLDLEIHEGEAITIIGGSGMGKSVMLKLLIGLLRIDGGQLIVVLGDPLNQSVLEDLSFTTGMPVITTGTAGAAHALHCRVATARRRADPSPARGSRSWTSPARSTSSPAPSRTRPAWRG